MNKKAHLPLHEWIIVILVVLLFASLTLKNALDSNDLPVTQRHVALTSKELTVTITGAVENPGTFQMKKGNTVNDVLALASPLPEADLSQIKGMSKLRSNQSVHIPSNRITVYLIGEIQNQGPIKIPKGTRLNELEKFIEPYPTTDLKIFKKKRILKEGEEIYIGSK